MEFSVLALKLSLIIRVFLSLYQSKDQQIKTAWRDDEHDVVFVVGKNAATSSPDEQLSFTRSVAGVF